MLTTLHSRRTPRHATQLHSAAALGALAIAIALSPGTPAAEAAPLTQTESAAASSNDVAVIADVQHEIDRLLVEFPGGTQTGPGEITWHGVDAVLNLPVDGSGIALALAASKCPSGKFCAYKNPDQSGAQLTFSSCDAPNSTAPLGGVGAIGNSTTSYIYGYNGSIRSVTVAAGSARSHPGVVTRLGCW